MYTKINKKKINKYLEKISSYRYKWIVVGTRIFQSRTVTFLSEIKTLLTRRSERIIERIFVTVKI